MDGWAGWLVGWLGVVKNSLERSTAFFSLYFILLLLFPCVLF